MVGGVSHTCDEVILASVVSVPRLVGNVAAESSSTGGDNPLLVTVGDVPEAVAHVPVYVVFPLAGQAAGDGVGQLVAAVGIQAGYNLLGEL